MALIAFGNVMGITSTVGNVQSLAVGLTTQANVDFTVNSYNAYNNYATVVTKQVFDITTGLVTAIGEQKPEVSKDEHWS
jgi:hypothetical protein